MAPPASPPPPTERTTVRREDERASYDRAVIDAIVDEALLCHLGFVDADGFPVVIPTIHARVGDVLYVHGSAASRTLRRLSAEGVEACCTITLLDGLVVARSGFWSSMNYRSVLVFGTPRLVVDPAERVEALDALIEHMLPGRSQELRASSDLELRATKVLALALDESSAKVRTGDPDDEPSDLDGPAWAGTIPFRMVAGAPVPAANLAPGIPVPDAVRRAVRRHTE